MSEAFEKYKDKRISEMRDRIRNNKRRNKENMKTFRQSVQKNWKNINKI